MLPIYDCDEALDVLNAVAAALAERITRDLPSGSAPYFGTSKVPGNAETGTSFDDGPIHVHEYAYGVPEKLHAPVT